MVRPFDLRDLTLIRRLGDRGIALNAMSALAENAHPLQSALVSMLVGGDRPTFVWKGDDGEARHGFIQLRVSESGATALVLYVSPRFDAGVQSEPQESALYHDPKTKVWLNLLDEAIAGIGPRGVQHVVAEVDELAPELVILRQAGFVVYTRQDVWQAEAGDPDRARSAFHLAYAEESDEWDIQLLYANTVPRLVQQVEPAPPLEHDGNWVLRLDGDLKAFVNIYQGAAARWLRFFIHPDVESEAAAIVAAALPVAFNGNQGRVYCCVRRYESWPGDALLRNGFEHVAGQAVMVRHTVHKLPRAVATPAAVLEAQGVSVSSPLIRQYRPSDAPLARAGQNIAVETLTGEHPQL